jgi:hypothetical protein
LKTLWQNWYRAWRSENLPQENLPEQTVTPRYAEGESWAWILPEQLAVGPLPYPEHLKVLQDQGIKAILTLCNPTEGALSGEYETAFHCVLFPLPDSRQAAPLLVSNLEIAVDKLHNLINTQGTVYVHCLAGVERSPTVCVSYLCRYHGLEIWEALNWVRSVHRRTGITSEQLRVISNYLAHSRG